MRDFSTPKYVSKKRKKVVGRKNRNLKEKCLGYSVFALFFEGALTNSFLVQGLLFLVILRGPLVSLNQLLFFRAQLEKVALVKGVDFVEIDRQMTDNPASKTFTGLISNSLSVFE